MCLTLQHRNDDGKNEVSTVMMVDSVPKDFGYKGGRLAIEQTQMLSEFHSSIASVLSNLFS